ncbi:hypothetical protein CBR_g21925 [Chara braunii]|uniref:RNA-directed DNA polymerase n=1 Tax=Chara braunii TaxID=69332 RepID=A0A388L1H6_CHABU|nr:hypothetical protein CBR_g21925 [Chara braunii]|eukprot:GBG76176.1 hypothetical protein CBR_g21925 [Chara braunii]
MPDADRIERGPAATPADFVKALEKRELARLQVPKVDIFWFEGARVSKWLELLEQVTGKASDEDKFKLLPRYVWWEIRTEIMKVAAGAGGDWAKFKGEMQRRFKLGDGLLTKTDLEMLQRDEFSTVGAFITAFEKMARKVPGLAEEEQCATFLRHFKNWEASALTKKAASGKKLTWAAIKEGVIDGKLDQVDIFQMRQARKKRKALDATASDGRDFKKMVEDAVAQLDEAKEAKAAKKTMAAPQVQRKAKKAVVQEEEEEEPEPQKLTKAQRKAKNLAQGGQGSGRGQVPQAAAMPPPKSHGQAAPAPYGPWPGYEPPIPKHDFLRISRTPVSAGSQGGSGNLPGVTISRPAPRSGMAYRPPSRIGRVPHAVRTRAKGTVNPEEPAKDVPEPSGEKEVVDVPEGEDDEDDRLRKEEDEKAEQRSKKRGAKPDTDKVSEVKKKKYAVRVEEGFDVEEIMDRILEGHNHLMNLNDVLASAPKLRDELKARLSRKMVASARLGNIIPKEAEWAEIGTKMDWKSVACGCLDVVVKGKTCTAMVDSGAKMNLIKEEHALRLGMEVDRSDNGVLMGANSRSVFIGTASSIILEIGKVKGWTNVVVMVQRHMVRATQPISPHITQPYINDLAVKGPKEKEEQEVRPGIRRFVYDHVQDLCKVLDLLKEHNLTASGPKSRHCMSGATILGFVCDERGRRPDTKKTNKILEWPTRFETITEVRSFLGTCGFWRIFIKGFAAKTEHLRKLVRQDQDWEWGDRQESVIEGLKKEFEEGGLVLGVPDHAAVMTRPFIVETDAGSTALGGVLIQRDPNGEEGPLRFESRMLHTAERNYSQFKRETLAILHCLRSFRNYLFGSRFVLRVDPTALAGSLKNFAPSDPTIARWLTYIRMFDFELKRIPGNKNRADGLSRVDWDKNNQGVIEDAPPVDGFLDSEEDVRLHINSWSLVEEVVRNMVQDQEEGDNVVHEREDDDFEEGEIKEAFRAEEYEGVYLELEMLLSCEMRERDACARILKMRPNFLVRDDHLFMRSKGKAPRRVVCGAARQIDVMAALHDGTAGGHRSADTAYLKIHELYYWDGMRQMIDDYCKSCVPLLDLESRCTQARQARERRSLEKRREAEAAERRTFEQGMSSGTQREDRRKEHRPHKYEGAGGSGGPGVPPQPTQREVDCPMPDIEPDEPHEPHVQERKEEQSAQEKELDRKERAARDQEIKVQLRMKNLAELHERMEQGNEPEEVDDKGGKGTRTQEEDLPLFSEVWVNFDKLMEAAGKSGGHH